jgi:hypothetical protein
MDYIKNTVIESTSIHAVPSSDRFIMVQHANDEVIGINYMQGCYINELNLFKEKYCTVDKQLTNYYKAIRPLLKSSSEIENIDHAIWLYINYLNNEEEY